MAVCHLAGTCFRLPLPLSFDRSTQCQWAARSRHPSPFKVSAPYFDTCPPRTTRENPPTSLNRHPTMDPTCQKFQAPLHVLRNTRQQLIERDPFINSLVESIRVEERSIRERLLWDLQQAHAQLEETRRDLADVLGHEQFLLAELNTAQTTTERDVQEAVSEKEATIAEQRVGSGQ